jgi:hypothetical protein
MPASATTHASRGRRAASSSASWPPAERPNAQIGSPVPYFAQTRS